MDTLREYTLERDAALKFCQALECELGTDTLIEIASENETRDDKSCATHDYCDANIIMQKAFESLGVTVFDQDGKLTGAMINSINEAWGLARKLMARRFM